VLSAKSLLAPVGSFAGQVWRGAEVVYVCARVFFGMAFAAGLVDSARGRPSNYPIYSAS
jgi:hypothetical protein